MKKATTLAIFVTTSFYMAVGCIGYGGFGDAAPGNLLTGFGFYNPYWLVDIANVFIMVHLLGAYQVTKHSALCKLVLADNVYCFNLSAKSLIIAQVCCVSSCSYVRLSLLTHSFGPDFVGERSTCVLIGL